MAPTQPRADLRLIETPSETPRGTGSPATRSAGSVSSSQSSQLQPSPSSLGGRVGKVRVSQVQPLAVDKVRGGQRVKVDYHGPTATVTSARKTTANGRDCYMLDLACGGGERHAVYVGLGHTVWLVVDEKIVDEH